MELINRKQNKSRSYSNTHRSNRRFGLIEINGWTLETQYNTYGSIIVSFEDDFITWPDKAFETTFFNSLVLIR